MPQILLIDNGSSRPESTLNLRRLAQTLSLVSGQMVHPVSLMHANKAPVEALNQQAAEILQPHLHRQLVAGKRAFLLIPVFYGVSRALTSFVPDVQNKLQAEFGEFHLQTADVLCPLPHGEPRLVELLVDLITYTERRLALSAEHLFFADHGSPIPTVTQVRQWLAKQMREKFPNKTLYECVMERRSGQAYDFNGALLDQQLRHVATKINTDAPINQRTFIVSLLFTSAGTHAGAGGDIEQICAAVMKDHPHIDIHTTPLVGEHPLLIDILQQRMNDAITANPTTLHKTERIRKVA
ncbi:MAG TPA: cobalamin biosynthesis protein CbiX [Thiothrix sp.]|nr:cobalamin biosynthesis protein CbiX [Thiothrix sp.]